MTPYSLVGEKDVKVLLFLCSAVPQKRFVLQLYMDARGSYETSVTTGLRGVTIQMVTAVKPSNLGFPCKAAAEQPRWYFCGFTITKQRHWNKTSGKTNHTSEGHMKANHREYVDKTKQSILLSDEAIKNILSLISAIANLFLEGNRGLDGSMQIVYDCLC